MRNTSTRFNGCPSLARRSHLYCLALEQCRARESRAPDGSGFGGIGVGLRAGGSMRISTVLEQAHSCVYAGSIARRGCCDRCEGLDKTREVCSLVVDGAGLGRSTEENGTSEGHVKRWALGMRKGACNCCETHLTTRTETWKPGENKKNPK